MRAIILHCWGGTSQYCWYPWAQVQLQQAGWQVTVPDLPNTQRPQQVDWVATLTDLLVDPAQTWLIGHSLGCTAIMRYLEQLHIGQFVGVGFVAAPLDNRGINAISNFFSTDFDWAAIRARAKQFVIIHSDNDPYIPLSQAKQLREYVGGELIVVPDGGHFSGPLDQLDSCTKLPFLVDVLLK